MTQLTPREAAKLIETTLGANDFTNYDNSLYVTSGFLPLNKCLTGSYDNGYAHGRMYEMFGPSSSGKTILATLAMIHAQQCGGIAVFIDYEKSFDPALGEKLGLNLESPFFVYKQPKTWESGNEMAVKAASIIRSNKVIDESAPIFIVQDSIAAAVPKSQFDKGESFDALNMNDTTALARVTSTTLKVIKSMAADIGFSILYLNQVRTKPGVMFGDPTTTPGGVAMEFYSDARIQLGRKKKMSKEGGGLLSQTITAKVIKSKFTRPFQATELNLSWNDDGSARFDVGESLIKHAVEVGALSQTGRFVEWEGKKYNGVAQLGTHIESQGQIEMVNDLLRNFNDGATSKAA